MPRRPRTGFAPGEVCYDPVTATIIAVAAVGGGIAYTESQQKKNRKKATAAAEDARAQDEQAAKEQRDTENRIKAAQAERLKQPTAGFGPNTNTARSFLTSL